MRFSFALGPIVRVSLGLIALFTSLVMIADLFLGLLPQRAELELRMRQRVVENVAAQTAVLLKSSDTQLLAKSLQQVMERNRDVLSVALRRSNGGIIAQRGDHARHWTMHESERSRWNHVQVSLYAGGKQWGTVEMAFVPAEPRSFLEWIREPVVLFYLALFVGGFLVCYVYLRRVMQYLDPSTAVPERVRAAFDTLSDAVLVLDPQGRIMLANRAFRDLHPEGKSELQGRAVSDLKWLPRHVVGDSTSLPWDPTLRGEAPAPDERMSIAQPGGALPVETIVRCSPVKDTRGAVRGCIVTFRDVTDVYAANDQLRQTLGDLERTREQINAQNEELRRLAMRDPMTGCFNRRAFFATAEGLVGASAKGNANLCCIMSDIDHFKGFNDLYGHSVGDQVIQVVARALAGSIRTTDVLCRYGGEEFCILLPNTGFADACTIAERARDHRIGCQQRHS